MESSIFKDYYGVLGVPFNISNDDLVSAYRELARRFHPDKGKEEDDSVMGKINDAFDGLGRGRNSEVRNKYDKSWREHFYGSRKESWDIKESEEVYKPKKDESNKPGNFNNFFDNFYFNFKKVSVGKNEIRISENDLGLLTALVIAHKSKNEGVWNVMRSETDERDWMPKRVYQVRKDSSGRVSILRQINDWRLPNNLGKEISVREDGMPWNTAKLVGANIVFKEEYLNSMSRNFINEPIFPPDGFFTMYLPAIKKLAYKISRVLDHPSEECNIFSEVRIINNFADSVNTEVGTGNRREEKPIAYDELKDRMEAASNRVILLTNKRREEGQQRQTEGCGYHGSGEKVG